MRVAVVGSGVSGLAATWLLNEYSAHEVNLYEKADYPGGHTNTQHFSRKGKESCMVDTGFIVLNPVTYPNFLRFLNLLRIPLLQTEMTFSVSRDRGRFEWAGEASALFCQWTNLFNPRMYRMIFDIFRFNLFALDLLREENVSGTRMSIGQYLDREGYGEGFKEDYLLPMTAAIWSTPADQAALDFPASTLIRFLHNHHLLQITGKPKWLTVQGGSKKYVDAVLAKLPSENLHLNSEIVGVSPRSKEEGGGVELVEASGSRHHYDHVILATHSDTTLQLLRNGGEVTEAEEKVLRPWQWSKNEAVLHWDERLMPTRQKAYSAWNYLTFTSSPRDHKSTATTASSVDTVSLTYDMNILQHLSEDRHGPVLVTLNPPFPADPSKTIGKFSYDHPMMTHASITSQAHLPDIQNTRGVSYVGAWTKYGFHEDGFSSSMRLLTSPTGPFHVRPPFALRPAQRPIHDYGLGLMILRLVVSLLEVVRKRSEPVWAVVVWVVVLGMFWAEQGVQAVGLQDLSEELERLRVCWTGPDLHHDMQRRKTR